MAANLTPMYYKAEREYRRAQTLAEQLECLQQMLQLIPKHKGTDHLQADIKSRLKEVRRDLQQQANAPKSGRSFRFPRQGAGRIVIVGGPNSGKSRVLRELTDADVEVTEFPFATREPLPGMMKYKGVQVQLIDTPPVTPDQLEPWMLNLVRTADGVVLCFDGSSDEAPEETLAVMKQFAQRKTRFANTTGFDPDSFAAVNVTTTMVVTRADDSDCRDRVALLAEDTDFSFPTQYVEFSIPQSVADLRRAIFEQLRVIRVFTKPPGKPADMEAPLTVHPDGTVEDLALQVHEDLFRELKHARLWRSGEHEGQIVGREYRLREGDVIELH